MDTPKSKEPIQEPKSYKKPGDEWIPNKVPPETEKIIRNTKIDTPWEREDRWGALIHEYFQSVKKK